MRTIPDSVIPSDCDSRAVSDTALTQKAPETVKYPVKVKHRGQVLAKIYKPSESYPLYRACWRANGQRRMKAFATYSAAKTYCDSLVESLYKGSQVTALTPAQATDALAAFERLRAYYVETGRKVSLLGAVSQFADATKQIKVTLADAVTGFLTSVADVKRVDIGQAVEDFITAETPRTKSSNGQRAQLSTKYNYNRAIMLRRFAGVFPGTALADLSKDHVDKFFAVLGELKSKSRNRKPATSAKIRNHHRAAIRQFLQWAVRKDYLSVTHRLAESDGMRPERANTADTEFYTPAEFKALLDTAQGPMRAIVAIGGLAGLRTQELLRLDWADVWRVENHIEVTKGKAKTRQRRLVEMVPALAQWLADFKDHTGKLWAGHEITFQQHLKALCEKAVVEIKGKKVAVVRKPNGLRHSFCSYHFAQHGNENLTAQQAGNSPAMVHASYKGLATKKTAQQWFAVAPEQAENVIGMTTAVI
jgi:integrase